MDVDERSQASDGQAPRKPPLAPGLHIVATPIGNMRDITKAAQSARAAIAVTVALIWKIVRRFAGCSTSTPRQTPGPSV